MKKFDKEIISEDIISSHMTIDGKINSLGSTHVVGKITGQIDCNILTIGKTGIINGNVKAKEILIEGTFNGEIFAEYVKIKSGANVDAKILYQSIYIEPGSLVKGKIQRQDCANEEDDLDHDKPTLSSKQAKKS